MTIMATDRFLVKCSQCNKKCEFPSDLNIKCVDFKPDNELQYEANKMREFINYTIKLKKYKKNGVAYKWSVLREDINGKTIDKIKLTYFDEDDHTFLTDAIFDRYDVFGYFIANIM